MKVSCPKCSTAVPASDISLNTGWGKCATCDELFPLADVLPGYRSPDAQAALPERPFDARALLERSDQELFVHVPAEGWRTSAVTLIGFTTFWLGFIAFWTTGALGVFGNQAPTTANWLFAAFSIPFWIVGFILLTTIAWKLRGTTSLQLHREGAQTCKRCLIWSKSRWIEIDQLQHARPYEPLGRSEDGTPSNSVELVYRGGTFILPADSAAEAHWLIAQINDFLRKHLQPVNT